MTAQRPLSSRPIVRITCSACGLEQPLSMDCVGCRRGFSMDELQAARQSLSAPAAPAASALAAAPAAPPIPSQDTFSAPPAFQQPVFKDQPSSDLSVQEPTVPDPEIDGDLYDPMVHDPDLHGDVYDPETAVHTPKAPRDYVGGPVDLSADDLIQESFQGTFVNFLPVAAVTIVVSIPAWLYSLYFLAGTEAVGAGEIGWKSVALRFVGMLVVSFLSQLLGAAALTHVIRCWLSDRTVVLTESIGIALRSLGVLVVLTVVQSVCIGIGYLFFLIPGVLLTAAWAVAVPAMVVERLGVGESLTRSWRLTDGNRLNIFLAFFILGLVNAGIGWISFLVIPESLSTAFDASLGTVFTAVESVMTALIYFKLRSADEGVPIDGLG